MLLSTSWRSKTALLLAVGIASTATFPMWLTVPAIASEKPDLIVQRFPQSVQLTVPAGTIIPVRLEEAERIVVTPDETASVTLTVADDIRSDAGTVAIRAGSQIEGELRPTRRGTQFVAEELITRNRQFPINATSQVFTETQTIDRRSNPDILRGALIGAAAGAVISKIFGGIDLGGVLTGAGLGAVGSLLLRGSEEVEVVVIEPETDLDLTLQSDFVLR